MQVFVKIQNNGQAIIPAEVVRHQRSTLARHFHQQGLDRKTLAKSQKAFRKLAKVDIEIALREIYRRVEFAEGKASNA